MCDHKIQRPSCAAGAIDHERFETPARSLDAPASLLHADQLTQATILIVDDQPVNVAVLTALLGRAGFANLYSTTNPREALELIDTLHPSLLLLDLHMPVMDGFAVMQRLREVQSPDEYFPILVLTADPSPDTKRRALENGAHDFLTKPFDTAEVRLRVANLLRTQALYAAAQRHNATLEQQVRERTEKLERSHLETLQALALAAEFRDDETGQHTRRVGQLAAAVGQTLGLPPMQVDLLRQAAPLHDVGKIGIPDRIVLKPGKLTTDEFAVIQTHTTIGYEILAPCQSATLRMARQIALTHHERWDGGGYPNGLAGELIPLAGRIVAVADAFDAMTHDRVYRAARPVGEALEEIARERGRQFDPCIGDALHHTITSYETI